MKLHDSYDQPMPYNSLHGQMQHIIWHNVHYRGQEAGFENVTTMFKHVGTTTSCTWNTVHGIITTTLDIGTIISKDDEGITIQRSVHDMYPLLRDYLSWLQYHTK